MGYDFKTEDKIIDVLGEELFNKGIENPNYVIAFSWLFSFSIAEFDKANGINSAFSNKLLEIREELGEDLCSWCSKNYQELGNLITILSSYAEAYENTKKFREKLKQLIEVISYTNHDAKITPLISAFGGEDGTNPLLKLFKCAKVYYVQDLFRLLGLTIGEEDHVLLIRFIKWLSKDKKSLLKSELHNLFRKDRDEEIIRKRAEGATREKTSNEHGITYEGVRLIEKKFQCRFESYILRMMPHYILYAFSKNIYYISIEDINELFGDLSSIFTYCLKESNCSAARWSDELTGFIIGEGKWYKQLGEYKEGLPQILDSDCIDKLIADIIGYLAIDIDFEVVRKLVLADYYLSAKVYLKKRINLSQIYFFVLEKYYPNGIRLYDGSEIMRIRNYVRELFGDVYLPEKNRAIAVSIASLTVLCDKGMRILPSGIKISKSLLRKIHDAIIEFEKNEIKFAKLFERFREELLENSNITNKYFLQGVLRQNFAEEFNFKRYSLIKRKSLEAAK